jgi:hypothetical protein
MLKTCVDKKEPHHPVATRGESQRMALPVSRSTYVIEEQQSEFGIGAPALFYLFFFGVFVLALTKNFLLVAITVGLQGFIFRNLLKDKPQNFLQHLLTYPLMQRHFVHRCKKKVGLVRTTTPSKADV